MKPRHLTSRLLAALADTPVVFLQGPRQSGKTTLVRNLKSHGFEAEYRTLDDAAVFAAASEDPDGFVAGLPEYVILDEVQRAPGLFRAIKKNVDENRSPGRFLLTGSANASVLPKVSEFLTGRVEILTLLPFSQGEIEGRGSEGFVDACFGRDFVPGGAHGLAWPALVKRIVPGGFPEAVSRLDPMRREDWFGSFVTSILERDVRELMHVHDIAALLRLLRLIAARSSGLLNMADLARDAGLSHTTIQRHWALLEAVFFVRSLPAWSANLSSRLVKTPKVQIEDSGLLCYLLGVNASGLLGDHLMNGPVLESFVAAEISRQSVWSRTRPALHHYRTVGQQEVDLLLEDRAGRIVGIEVRKAASLGARDFAGLKQLSAATGKRFLRGVLLYAGATAVAFGPNLFAVPVSALWQTPARQEG